MASRAIRRGDILEVRLSDDRLGYVQYIGRHVFYRDTVVAAPGVFGRRPSNFNELFRDGVVMFYPASLTVQDGLLEIVGRGVVEARVPTRTRRRGGMRDRQILSWIIEENGRDLLVKETLDESERYLPIGEIVGHPIVVQRIENQWRPEMEVDSFWVAPTARGLMGTYPFETGGAESEMCSSVPPGSLTHYLYFKSEAVARQVAAVLRARGYASDYRLSVDGDQWLVNASHSGPTSEGEVSLLRDEMEAIARAFDGEYDGWEGVIVPNE